VISATLISEPAAPVPLSFSGLLPGGWELLFFGGPVDPYADADKDGISNLQEFLDGTDPMNPLSHSAFAVNLGLPTLKIEPPSNPGKGSSLMFNFPASYAAKFNFMIQSTPDLGMAFNSTPLSPAPAGGGDLTVELPVSSEGSGFYRLMMTLK
jgi:hypothetical protein